MTSCRCQSFNHEHHRGQVCSAEATEPDGYCKACHDLAANEWAQTLQRLDAAADVEGSSAKLAGVTKEAAKLSALASESSSSAMMKAAQVVAGALDRNANAANQSHQDTMLWQKVAVGATFIIVIVMILTSPWCAPTTTPSVQGQPASEATTTAPAESTPR